MPALKYWNGAAWATISNVAGPAGPAGAAGPGGYSLAEEFKPSGGATTVTLSQVPQFILVVARDGMVQSAADSHYSLAGAVLTFTDSFNGSERVVVEYAMQGTAPIAPFNGAGLTAGSVGTTQLTDGSVTTAKILDGTIATADLANASVSNIKLASDTARANLLTNGSFEIWQRGNGPFTGSVYSADRWTVLLGGASTASVTRDAVNADGGGGYCLAAVYTHNASSNLYQPSTDSVAQLRGRTVTFSIRVKTSTANAVRPICSDGVVASNGSYHSGSGQYETLTITKVMSGSSTLVNTGVSLDASCTAYLDNAMLVVGSVAADYSPLHPADELARCMRYYEVMGAPGGNDYVIAAYSNGAHNIHWPMMWKVAKGGTPTVTKWGTWGTSNASQPNVAQASYLGAQAYFTLTAAGYGLIQNTGAACFTAEWNP